MDLNYLLSFRKQHAYILLVFQFHLATWYPPSGSKTEASLNKQI